MWPTRRCCSTSAASCTARSARRWSSWRPTRLRSWPITPSLGEDWPRALRYHMLAGQQAQKLFANHEAIEHFRKALRCAEHLPPRIPRRQRQQIHASLGQLLTSTGQYEPALEHLQEALALAIAAGGSRCPGARMPLDRLPVRDSAANSRSRSIGSGGLAGAGRPAETAATAELLAIAGLIITRQGNYDQALELCEKAMQVAERLGDKGALAFACNTGPLSPSCEANTGAPLNFEKTRDSTGRPRTFTARRWRITASLTPTLTWCHWAEPRLSTGTPDASSTRRATIYTLAFVQNNLGGSRSIRAAWTMPWRYYQGRCNRWSKSAAPPMCGAQCT